jgi:hypothetical protein
MDIATAEFLDTRSALSLPLIARLEIYGPLRDGSQE